MNSGMKDAPRDVSWIINEVGSTKAILEELKSPMDSLQSSDKLKLSGLFKALNASNGPLKTWEWALKELESRLCQNTKFGRAGTTITWPFKEKAVQKILEVVKAQKVNFFLQEHLSLDFKT